MKADLTRATFDPTRHYAAVIHQQQRVLIDADLNEQQAIASHRVRLECADVIGPCGTAIDASGLAGGFAIAVVGTRDNLTIGAGHYYVGGLLCENEGNPAGTPVPITGQPDLPLNGSPILPTPGALPVVPPVALPDATKIVQLTGNPAAAATPQDGTYVAFLDVWLRHITSLEDGRIREVALGGPDTATRAKTVWQVKLLRVADANAGLACGSAMAAWDQHLTLNACTGRLAARAEPTAPPKGPCVLSPQAGYRRLENQLYRVEIHVGGAVPGAVRYKWSRDNGAIVARCVDQPKADQIHVETLGRDKVLNLAAGHWVELSDETRDSIGVPGPLYEVLSAEDDIVTVKVPPAQPLNLADFKLGPKLRRWDGVDDAKTTWTTLEDGIEVRFDAGTYVPGDYWLIPARTATGDVEWPQAANAPAPLLRRGIEHRFCKLAVLTCIGGQWTLVEDCRATFPAATALTHLHYLGGDGQEATPDPLNPQRIDIAPLAAGVANGKWPVIGAKVRFAISVAPGDPLDPPSDGRLGGTPDKLVLDVVTDARGIAECAWALDPTTPVQTVTATLLEAGNPATWCEPLTYRARLRRAQEVSYDPTHCADLLAQGVNTVQGAIDALCNAAHAEGSCCCVTVGPKGQFTTLFGALLDAIERNQKDICVCLQPGDHLIDDKWFTEELWQKLQSQLRETHLKIGGCGLATRILVTRPWEFRFLHSLILENLGAVSRPGLEPLLAISGCGNVTLSSVQLLGRADKLSLLAIAAAQRVVVERSTIEAYTSGALALTVALLGAFGPLNQGVVKEAVLRDELSFARTLEDGLEEALARPPEYRLALAERVRKQLEQAVAQGLDAHGAAAMGHVLDAYEKAAIDRGELVAALTSVRATAAVQLPGAALAFADATADATIVGNRIVGLVSPYGLPGQPLNVGILPALRGAFADGRARLGNLRGELRFIDNVATRIVLGIGLLQELQQLAVLPAGQQGVLADIYANASVNDNRFTAAGGFDLVSRTAHVDGNTFENGTGGLVARLATIVGNLSVEKTRLLVASPEGAAGVETGANLWIDVVPLP